MQLKMFCCIVNSVNKVKKDYCPNIFVVSDKSMPMFSCSGAVLKRFEKWFGAEEGKYMSSPTEKNP